jgi:N-acetylglucosamine malate deacetylase 2
MTNAKRDADPPRDGKAGESERPPEAISPIATGPPEVIRSLVAESLENNPLPAAFEAAGLWVKKHQEARFGYQAKVAGKVLERLARTRDNTEPAPRVVVLVAHPDDEAIGAGAVLRSLPDVTVVHVTDGAPRDEGYAESRGYPNRHTYARARREEVIAALSLIGVPPERIRGLGFVDGEATLHLVELSHRIADIIEELRPDVVLTHPYEGGHSDHDATAFAVHLAVGIVKREGTPPPLLIEFTSYHNFKGRRRLFDFLPFGSSKVKTVELSEEDKEIKRQMFEAFESQRALLHTIPIEVERFRAAPRYLFTVPPHEGTLEYERVCKKITGAEWRAHAEKALEKLRRPRLVKGG